MSTTKEVQQARRSRDKEPKTKRQRKSFTVHPPYKQMVVLSVTALSGRHPASRQAILRFIRSNFSIRERDNVVKARFTKAVKSLMNEGILCNTSGVGSAGSFRLYEQNVETKQKVRKSAADDRLKQPTNKASKNIPVTKATHSASKRPAPPRKATSAVQKPSTKRRIEKKSSFKRSTKTSGSKTISPASSLKKTSGPKTKSSASSLKKTSAPKTKSPASSIKKTPGPKTKSTASSLKRSTKTAVTKTKSTTISARRKTTSKTTLSKRITNSRK